MRLAQLTRRTTATIAATSLLTVGGIVTGGLVGVANAQTVTDISPAFSNNVGSPTFVIRGTGFNPATASVALVPTFTATGVGAISGTVDVQNSPANGSSLTVSFPLDNAAPSTPAGGGYDVQVSQPGVPAATVASCGRVCFNINQPSQPSVTGSAFDTATGRGIGTGKLILTGRSFARGGAVQFVLPNGAVDDKLVFTAENGTSTGYPSTTQIKGGYTQASGFTPGQHFLRVVNTDGQTGGTLEFWQPQIDAVAPSRLGQGGSTTVVVTGQGIRAGSKILINASSSDLTVGPSTVNEAGTQISAVVTATSSASTSVARTVTIAGPDGGYTARAGVFAIGAAPSVNSISVSQIGRNASAVAATISGSGFISSNPLTQFSFGGGGLTASTQSVAGDGTSAVVLLTATPDAVLGGRSVTATNPDIGTGTLGPNTAGQYPLTVTPAPIISAVTPGGQNRGITQNVTITGSGFTAPSGGNPSMTLAFSGGDITVNGTPSVVKGSGGTADTLTASISVGSAATPGPRDVTLTNLTDKGNSTCTGCFSVDSLTLGPVSAPNAGTRTLTFTTDGLSPSSVPVLAKVGAPAYQPDLTGTSWTLASDGRSGTAVFDFTGVAPGVYNARVTTGSVVQSCSSCFSVSASAATLTSIAPAKGGQGAVKLPVTLTGTNFSRGMSITVGSATVTDITYVDTTTMTANLTIPGNATVGAVDVKVTNADGTSPVTKAGAFTVTAGPKPATIAPTALGQGATNQTLTITGPGFIAPTDSTPGSTVDLGAGVTILSTTVTDKPATSNDPNPNDTIAVVVNVAPDAAPGTRDVVVTNPDAGRGSIAAGLTINEGPRPTGMSPSTLKPGDAVDVVISGTGFTDGSLPSASGVTFEDVALADDGTLTAKATVADGAVKGARNLNVLNDDGGFGACTACVTISTPPAPPTALTFTAGQNSATIGWTAPTDDGGSPLTGYTVSTPGQPPVSVGGGATSATVPGLTGGTSYTFSVVAQNSLGDSSPATITGTPYDVPTAPTTVSATGGDGSATVSFSGQDPRGSAITEFTVRLATSAGEILTTGTSSPITVRNLFNGTTYTVSVKAQNAAGYGAYSAESTVTPTAGSLLTSVSNTRYSESRRPILFKGRLTRTDGKPVVGERVAIRLTPDIGGARVARPITNSNGDWSFRFGPLYNTTVSSSYGSGDSTVTAPTYRIAVYTLMQLVSPNSGTTSSSRSALNIVGKSTPNKAGRVIGLYQGSTLVARTTVQSNGRFTFATRFPKGIYRFTFGLGATSGNAGGNGHPFQIRRS